MMTDINKFDSPRGGWILPSRCTNRSFIQMNILVLYGEIHIFLPHQTHARHERRPIIYDDEGAGC